MRRRESGGIRKRLALLAGAAVWLACLLLTLFPPALVGILGRQAQDVLVRLAATPDRSGQVALVDIDEASLRTLGQWPWPRHLVARLTDRLWEAGASVVAFDILFAEEDRLSPHRVAAAWQEAFGEAPETGFPAFPKGSLDDLLAASLSRGRAVLGCYLSGNPAAVGEPEGAPWPLYRGRLLEINAGPEDRALLPEAYGLVRPLDVLAAAAAAGFINTTPDPDNINRRTPLVIRHGDHLYPSLGLEALRLHLRAPHSALLYDAGGVRGVDRVRTGPLELPTDAHARLVLRYRSTPFPRRSAVDVLEGRGLEVFSNRVVFVGASAAGLRDLVATPLHDQFPGVEVHATLVDNALAGDPLAEPRWMFHVNLLSVAVLGALLLWAAARRSAAFSLGLLVLMLAGHLGFSLRLLAVRGLVVSPLEIPLALVLVFGATILVRYWASEHERQRIRRMFGTMVSTPVLEYLEEHPESFSLRGKKVEATVFFSDLVDFTGVAERMDPETLAAFMNRYLTPVTEIIMERGGYVDKFNGDAVMAVWGVPFGRTDHARQACLAALAQRDAVAGLADAFDREFGVRPRVCMGLHSGWVTAGNMGSANRFEYTVLGEVVNSAARFETANRAYGTAILAGEAAFDGARDAVEGRLLDRLVVKGASRPVRIYEILCARGGLDEHTARLRERYETALEAYWSRSWDRAEALLREALRVCGEDGPSLHLLERVRACRADPPPPDWDGSTRRTVK